MTAEEDSYVEENNIGVNAVPAVFDPTKRRFLSVSNRVVILYDAESGKRLRLFRHSHAVIGLHFIGDELFSITKNGFFIKWDCESGEQLSSDELSSDLELLWSYEVKDEGCEDVELFVVGRKKTNLNGSSDGDDNLAEGTATLYRFLCEMDDAVTQLALEPVIDLPVSVPSKRHLTVATDLAVIVCDRREVRLLPFPDSKHSFPDDCPLIFRNRTKFATADDEQLAYDDVVLVGNHLYVTLNIGRIYVWNHIRNQGLGHCNKTFLNAHNCAFLMVAVNDKSLFTAGGECQVAKWNLSTSGVGRWHRAEYLSVEAPVEHMLLSPDAVLLAVNTGDNQLLIIRTASMTVQCKAETLEWNLTESPLNWARLTLDPAQPEFIVTNAALGHIQWVDPIKWKTVEKIDISNENPPPRDDFNSPNYLWLNVYLVHLSVSRLLTCECRRNDPNRTYFKVYSRVSDGSTTSFRLDECAIVSTRIAFVRSTFDGFQSIKQVDDDLTAEEFLRVDMDGKLDVVVADTKRAGRWRTDAARTGARWRGTTVMRACSHVRQQAFATVNQIEVLGKGSGEISSPMSKKNSKRKSGVRRSKVVETETHGDATMVREKRDVVLLWQMTGELRVRQVVHCVREAREVEWSPPLASGRSLLLIVSATAVYGYDPYGAFMVWTVDCCPSEGLSLFSSPLCCFVHEGKRVIFFDAESGEAIKCVAFRHSQSQIVASSTSADNILLSGLSNEGLSTLKRDIPSNEVLGDESKVVAAKRTPFSQLLGDDEVTTKTRTIVNGTAEHKTRPKNLNGNGRLLELQPRVPMASKVFDGPAYTLAPLTQLAPLYIRACIMKRRVG